jgi:NAD(P)H dehydrogenase (quinone)
MKILVINGHPNSESFNQALSEAYIKGAQINGKNEVRFLQLAQMQFDPNLAFGYAKRVELEPELIEAQEWVKWCDHLVIVHPIWWGSLPAQLKGFFDRAFLPGFAFKYREKGVWWDKLLAGRTAEIIYTIDQPIWYYKLINGAPGLKQLKKMTLEFCGFKVKRVTGFANVRFSTPEKRSKWLEQAFELGNKC